MEGDGPCASMILYKYYWLIKSLETQRNNPDFKDLNAMFDPMIKVAKKYCNLALCCNAILLSTMLHPAWRLSLIEDKYPKHVDIANKLLQEAFKEKLKLQSSLRPAVAVQDSNIDDSDGDDCTYYPKKKGPSQEEDKIQKYKAGAWPLSKKGDPLQWWKVSLLDIKSLELWKFHIDSFLNILTVALIRIPSTCIDCTRCLVLFRNFGNR